MPPPIPTLIVEQRTLLRKGLSSLLERTQYKVVAAAGSIDEIGKEHLEQALLAIVGVSADMDKTITTLRRVRQLLPEAKLFMVAEGSDQCDSQELLSNGADGCVIDVTSREVLIKALDLMLLQQRLIVLGPTGRANQQQPPSSSSGKQSTETNGAGDHSKVRSLSERERQVLGYVAGGASNKVIARGCLITEATVKAHMKAIVRKIAVQNRTQAAIWAVEHGLAGDPSRRLAS